MPGEEDEATSSLALGGRWTIKGSFRSVSPPEFEVDEAYLAQFSKGYKL